MISIQYMVFFPVWLQFSWYFFETCISYHLLHVLFLEPLRGVYDTYSYYSSACVATARLNMLDCLVFFLFLFEVQVLRVRVRRLCLALPLLIEKQSQWRGFLLFCVRNPFIEWAVTPSAKVACGGIGIVHE